MTHFAIDYPHILFNIPPSHLAFHQLFPESANVTTVVTWFCFPKSTAALPDFEKEVQAYYEMVETFVPEDKSISERTQRGLQAAWRGPGGFRFMSSLATRFLTGCSIVSFQPSAI